MFFILNFPEVKIYRKPANSINQIRIILISKSNENNIKSTLATKQFLFFKLMFILELSSLMDAL